MADTQSSCSESEPFALQVLGNSMEPEFPENCIIMVEPTDAAISGMYVMVMVDGTRWFRQYMKDDQGERLIALNSLYPEIPLEGLDWKIEGVIMQRNIKRQVKHYDYQ
ncbi:MAG: S24 family peptidase [bacterium]